MLFYLYNKYFITVGLMDNTKRRNLFLLLGGIIIIAVIICLSSSPTSTRGRFKIKEQLQTVQRSVAMKSRDIYTALNPYLNLLFPVSKELVLFDAFFDKRARSGHRNLTIIFIAASRGVFEKKMITGCGVGISAAKHFHVRYVQEDHLMHAWKGEKYYKFEELALECYDVPLNPGDRAFIEYRTSQNTTVVIHTARPVVIPEPKVTPTGPNNISVVVCTKAHNRGVSWLPEFLRYQKTLGVDHVHLSVLDEFIKDNGFLDYLSKDKFFVENQRKNYITVKLWNEWHENREWYDHGTILMYLDCLYRYQGTYDYISLLDTDDFFTVRVPGMSLKDMILKYCSDKTTGSCAFRWLFYYPEICGLKRKVSEDGNVTAAINPHKAEDAQNRLKSIHRTEAVLDSSYHDATCSTCLMEGYKVVRVPPDIAYAAHQRNHVGKEIKSRCYLH